MNSLFTLLLFLLTGSGTFAQHTEWMAFQKSGELIQVRGLGVDRNENVYSVGRFNGELRVGSSEAFLDTFATYGPWQQHVFTKHDPNGRLLFVSLIETRGGNSNMAFFRKMHVTSEGRMIVHVICKYHFYYVNSRLEETKLSSGYNHTSILIIDNNGVLLEHVSVPIKDCTQITEDENGNIFILARTNYRNSDLSQQLFRIDYGLTSAVEVPFPKGNINAIHCFDGKLWIATLDQYQKRGYYHSYNIGLFHSKLSDLQEFAEISKTEIGFSHFCKLQFVTEAKRLRLCLLSKASNEFTYNSTKLNVDKQETGLLVLNSKLELEDYTAFKGLKNDLSVIGLRNGSFILQFSVLDSVTIGGKTVQVYPRHRDFVYELVHVKLDPNLKFQWVVNGGGTATNYHVSEMVLNERETQLYVGADLIDYGDLDCGYTEVDWSSSYYIRKVNLQ